MASSAILLSSSYHKPLSHKNFPRLQAMPKAFHIVHRTFGHCATVIRCSAGRISDLKQPTVRRSANYEPSYWDYDQLQSLNNEYHGSKYKERLDDLKGQVKSKLHQQGDSLCYLELIDNLQRLGLSYHFEDEIQSILERMHEEISSKSSDLRKQDLYATALVFRLLRQHNFDVSQDFFDRFMDANGDFNARLCQDTKGLLQLYEASFYRKENEITLELGKKFARNYLNTNLNDKEHMDPEIEEMVLHALDTPFHWRMQRLEAREFIDLYEQMTDMNPTILELAKLDFNIVQSVHLSDIKYVSKWWKETHLPQKLPFSRDRVVESFLWTIGAIFEPQYGYCRRMSVKVYCLITIIDDVYDVYGTLEELEVFTEAVQRWDIKETNQLPEYMRHCYLELYNSINEMAYVFLQEQGTDISSYLRMSWADLCRGYLKEAKWYYSGYVPSLQEYLENGLVTIGAPLGILHAFFCISNPIEQEALECLNKHHPLIRCSSMILRLVDDLGTSPDEMKRGDVPKSIQCYMNDTGASGAEARAHVKFLIEEKWKQVNKEVANKDTPFTKEIIKFAANAIRMGQCIYQHGDGHGGPDPITKSRIAALVFKPISLAKVRRPLLLYK